MNFTAFAETRRQEVSSLIKCWIGCDILDSIQGIKFSAKGHIAHGIASINGAWARPREARLGRWLLDEWYFTCK